MRSLVIKAITVTAIFIFIKFQSDYNYYYLILVAGNLGIIVTDLIYFFRLKQGFPKYLNIKVHFQPLLLFFITSAAIGFYTFFDTIILGEISGVLAVGFYTTGIKVIRILQSFISDLGGVLLPRFSLLIEEKNKPAIDVLINKSLQYTLTTSIPLIFLLYLLAPEIIAIIGGSRFQPAVAVLQILSVLPLLIGLSNLFGIQILLPFKQESKMLRTVITGSVLSIILNILLCYWYQEKGAAFTCIAVEATVTLLMYFYVKEYVRFELNAKQVFSIVLCSTLFIPIIISVRTAIASPLHVFLIGTLLSLVTYFVIQLFAFKNKVFESAMLFISGLWKHQH
jgi:O-antigen/teichoic acid export membrane protein